MIKDAIYFRGKVRNFDNVIHVIDHEGTLLADLLAKRLDDEIEIIIVGRSKKSDSKRKE